MVWAGMQMCCFNVARCVCVCVRIPHDNLIQQQQQQLGEREVRESGCFVRLVFDTGSQTSQRGASRRQKRNLMICEVGGERAALLSSCRS